LFSEKIQYRPLQLGNTANELAFQYRIEADVIGTRAELSTRRPRRLERIRHTSAHYEAGSHFTALGHQNVIGPAGGTRIHDLDPQAPPQHGEIGVRIGKDLVLPGADDYDPGIKRKQGLEVFRGQVYCILWPPVGINTPRTDDQPARVGLATDKNPARTIAENQVTAIAVRFGELHSDKITDGHATNKAPYRMTLNLARAMMPVIAIAFAGITGAEEALPPSVIPLAGPRADVAEDWSQTYLRPEPAVRIRIERTRVFLDTRVKDLDDELSRLKDEGLLDRRGISKIRSALEHVRSLISRMAESVEANEKIDGRAARMVSYELGMAADTLARQANELAAGPDHHDDAVKGVSPEMARPQYPAKTLREGSRLVKETAQAIVHHLK